MKLLERKPDALILTFYVLRILFILRSVESQSKEQICGVWVDKENFVHLQVRHADGTRTETKKPYLPFIWTMDPPPPVEGIAFSVKKLEGNGAFNHLVQFGTLEDYQAFLKQRDKGLAIEQIRPLEHQFLLQEEKRLFADMRFHELKRCQLDIETHTSEAGEFSSAQRAGDFVLAIGLQMGDEQVLLTLEDFTAEAEKKLLVQLNETLQAWDPDIIEGHNIFKFDLDYLRIRCKRNKVQCQWGRFGQKASFRSSRIRIAERWIDYPRCDIPGRTVFDTYLMIQLFDLTTRDLRSYSLKNVAIYLGVTDPEADKRTYIAGDQIHQMFQEDRQMFLDYLIDDLRETKGIVDILLPTYFAQIQNFPMTLQEACLRGTASKVDLVFLEKYYHAAHTLPLPPEVSGFEGGYTKSFETGVFKEVLHFDVASLYPSLLMWIDRNPVGDELGIFNPMLKALREYRLKYKELARTSGDANEQQEYHARQASFKILINSFYGYLGFAGARFADSDLASEVTAKGRALLQELIEAFQGLGCTVLEADTDGIYLSPNKNEYFLEPGKLLEQVSGVLPEGIELEYDGKYESMFCYKAKNYALYDGKKY